MGDKIIVKFIHSESDSEWIKEFNNQEELDIEYEKINDGLVMYQYLYDEEIEKYNKMKSQSSNKMTYGGIKMSEEKPVEKPVEQIESELTSTNNTNSNDDDELFKDENKVQVGWFKFEKVGDKISGILEEVKIQAPTGDFKEQTVYVLRQDDGETINVGFASEKSSVIDRAKKALIGDILGFKFLEEIHTEKSKKFKNPAKSFGVYIKPMNKESFN